MARTKQSEAKRITAVKPATDLKTKRPHRFRAGTQALRAMRRLKRDAEPIIPLAVVDRCVRDVLSQSGIERMGKNVVSFIRNVMESVALNVAEDAVGRADDGKAITLRYTHMAKAAAKWLVDHRMRARMQ